ncbi:MAG: Na+/H+ antiporter subunit D [Microbacterium sp. SCN 70-200]|uniref:Na+/H+ antiporter subunit D n=1 Tax=unclassified Microbacterium TaxID=2609290 RepID=UPI00086901F8|nr:MULTISPECIES: Na+/H+ antiporter subunit D [unclassified Microbacterium]MBN9215145.1 Na+/H+ antiporter subunit D [Microbacterium sp.]ODT42569.1 MAG: Na+/H+ antiporter subunit D [Microbacterium sp. SCN 70-200]OJV80088.1 MAG: Na+/H+ antiporter subunit D [Microbacterium sp. 70-16]
MNALIPLVVTLPLLGAGVALIFGRRRRVQISVSVVTLTLVLAIAAVLLYTVDSSGQALAVSVGGWPIPFGIVLYVDRLAALLVVISSIVLLAVLLFSVGQGAADGDDDTPVTIFHPTYLILAAGIFNAFIAGDLFNLYVGFEILLVASYVLITLGSTESRIRTGVVYIVVSLVSSILFLAAIAAIYGALGTVNIAQISERMTELPQSTQLVLHLMLLLAFSIKAAVFPLSFWLPDSYPTAPAPVTAVFAGLLTKVGVYAMIRTETQIFRENDVNTLLLIVALATMIVGILGALAQAELKRILSFTLVSHVGYLVFGLAIATPLALGATIYYMVHHIIVQTTLFLAVGLIERRAGSTSILKVKGLMRAAPVLAVLYFIPAVNLGGLPPFSGFIGKFALFNAAAEVGTPLMYVLMIGGILTSLLTLYTLMRAWNLSFWREDDDHTEEQSVVERIEYLGAAPAADEQGGRRVIPRIMTATTAGMVAVTVALTVFAGPLYQLCASIGDALQEPVTLVHLEEEAAQ